VRRIARKEMLSTPGVIGGRRWRLTVRLDSLPGIASNEGKRYVMIRIQFPTDADRIRGNYLLATQAVVRRLKGQFFELTEHELRLLDEQRILFSVVAVPEPSAGTHPVG
jgi:hypothetical protein